MFITFFAKFLSIFSTRKCAPCCINLLLFSGIADIAIIFALGYFEEKWVNNLAVYTRKKTKESPEDDQIIAISGATVSSEAVVKIFNNYMDQIKTALTKEGMIGDAE